MNAYILTEGGKKIGFGHIARCVSLYQAFETVNIKPKLLVKADKDIDEIFGNKNYEIFDWLKQDKATFKALNNTDVVIIDSYLAGFDFYKNISLITKVPVYLDDNKRLDYPTGIVVNGNIHADTLCYPIKNESLYLLGPRFVPLRKEFWRTHSKLINRRVNTVMVTFGGNDLNNLTLKILKLLTNFYPDLEKKIIVANGFTNIDAIRQAKDKRTQLFENVKTEEMKKLMLKADMAISAGGQTLYELARIGVPTVVIAVAENQLNNVIGWERAGFIEYAGYYRDKGLADSLIRKIDHLMPHRERIKKSRFGRAYVDGGGARRIVNKILHAKFDQNKFKTIRDINLEVNLRPAGLDDCYDLWLWRNDSEARKWSFHKEKIGYPAHCAWFKSKLQNKGTKIYIAENKKNEKIGQVRFEINSASLAYININLNPKFFRKGFGSKVIRESSGKFINENLRGGEILAEIVVGNIISERAFLRSGYVFFRSARKNGIKLLILKFKNNTNV